MEIKTTKIARLLNESLGSRIIAFQGSSRASKTYNILIWIIAKCLTDWKDKGKVISIVRQTLPALRASVERDFFEILIKLEIYTESEHNKTERIYNLGGNLIEFFSCDEEMKVRGRKRDILFCNEANELRFDIWTQLLLRTSDFVIIDYNPSDEFHWIYDEVLTRKDVAFHIVTYKDNPFLSEETVKEIEKLQHVDTNLWNVFGLGLRGSSTASIYPKWDYIDSLPRKGAIIYGLDFGFNNPTALVECELHEGSIYSNELLYQSGLTNTDLIAKLKVLIPNKNAYLYADSAEPDRIQEIKKSGFNVHPAFKDVKDGIDIVKRHRLFITKNSLNLIKETKSYKWKQNTQGHTLEEPVKYLDHLKDAERYAVASYYKSLGKYNTSAQTFKGHEKPY